LVVLRTFFFIPPIPSEIFLFLVQNIIPLFLPRSFPLSFFWGSRCVSVEPLPPNVLAGSLFGAQFRRVSPLCDVDLMPPDQIDYPPRLSISCLSTLGVARLKFLFWMYSALLSLLRRRHSPTMNTSTSIPPYYLLSPLFVRPPSSARKGGWQHLS